MCVCVCVFSLWELHVVVISLLIIIEDFCRQWEEGDFFSCRTAIILILGVGGSPPRNKK